MITTPIPKEDKSPLQIVNESYKIQTENSEDSATYESILFLDCLSLNHLIFSVSCQHLNVSFSIYPTLFFPLV